FGMPGAAEAQDRRWAAELLGQVREGRDSDPAADEQRTLHVEPVAVSEGAEDAEDVATLRGTEGSRPRPDGLEQEGQLPRGSLAEAHRAWQRPPRRLEHEELAGDAGLQAPALDSEQRVRPHGLVAKDAKPFASAH